MIIIVLINYLFLFLFTIGLYKCWIFNGCYRNTNELLWGFFAYIKWMQAQSDLYRELCPSDRPLHQRLSLLGALVWLCNCLSCNFQTEPQYQAVNVRTKMADSVLDLIDYLKNPHHVVRFQQYFGLKKARRNIREPETKSKIVWSVLSTNPK